MSMRGKLSITGDVSRGLNGLVGKEGDNEVESADYGVAALGMCNDDGEGGDCPPIERNGVGRDEIGIDGMGLFCVIEAHLSKNLWGLRLIVEKEGGNVVYITAWHIEIFPKKDE